MYVSIIGYVTIFVHMYTKIQRYRFVNIYPELVTMITWERSGLRVKKERGQEVNERFSALTLYIHVLFKF